MQVSDFWKDLSDRLNYFPDDKSVVDWLHEKIYKNSVVSGLLKFLFTHMSRLNLTASAVSKFCQYPDNF